MALQQTGTVVRTFTSDKFGKLTLEVQGSGRYPDKIDFKTFDGAVISRLKGLGQGETVTVDFAIQSEKLSVGGKEITETGKDGKEWPVKIPMLKVTALSVEGQNKPAGAVPF